MKVYVASSWRNDRLDEVIAALRKAGHEVFDFRAVTGFHWSDIDPDWQSWSHEVYLEALGHPLAERGFAADLSGLEWAEAVVLVMPCGRSAHLELGWALGAGKKGIILLSEAEAELMYKLADEVCVDLAGVLIALRDIEGSAA